MTSRTPVIHRSRLGKGKRVFFKLFFSCFLFVIHVFPFFVSLFFLFSFFFSPYFSSAMIRRANEKKLREEIVALMADWKADIDRSTLIWL